MDAEEFRKYMESSQDKIAELKNSEFTSRFMFPKTVFIEILSEILNDEEKCQFLKLFTSLDINYQVEMIKSLKSDDTKIRFIENGNFTLKQALDIIKSMTDDGKSSVLDNTSLREKYKLHYTNFDIIIIFMSEQGKEQQIKLKDKMKELYGDVYYDHMCIIINTMEDDDKKIQLSEECDLDKNNFVNIIYNVSDEKKESILLSKKYNFNKYDIIIIISKMKISNIIQFWKDNREFIDENDIKIHDIVRRFSDEKQLEFFFQIDNMEIALEEKLKAIVVLHPETKRQINREGIKTEYNNALNIPFYGGSILVDLDNDLTRYKGYDELIEIFPQFIPFDKHDKLLELTQICPNLKIEDSLATSTAQEFINSERWIRDVLSHIQDDWTDIQKVAYIDYRIGQKISYAPDFDTEVSKPSSARALWKIIDSGYGVCDGISQVEQYILSLVGIESERVSGENHEFLKIKNIEIPRTDGTSVKGDTIVDPTWNLTANRYGAYPCLFARSYQEIRKFDTDKNGNDVKCHQNDEILSDCTIDIEESVLRDIYRSIGLAKEDGAFPISDMMDRSNEIAQKGVYLEQSIAEQLELLEEMHPDFYTCQNSTISILAGILLNHDEMDFTRLVVHRVYEKEDKEKRPLIYVYCNIDGKNEVFYAVDNETHRFVKFDREKFTEKYECYEMDMQKSDGVRPWEKVEYMIEEDITISSRNINSQEEDDTRSW